MPESIMTVYFVQQHNVHNDGFLQGWSPPPFDLQRIDLPSIPVLVAFYHACLG